MHERCVYTCTHIFLLVESLSRSRKKSCYCPKYQPFLEFNQLSLYLSSRKIRRKLVEREVKYICRRLSGMLVKNQCVMLDAIVINILCVCKEESANILGL